MNYSSWGTAFGQREPFTRRIRNLLKDYPDGLPVPKELIQNADDAQATETCLLLDLRYHSTENLINPELATFQGPALLFWNNKPFLESDFKNLCEFGGETKLEDRQKVGKFGLGFNSVYNLTDLPQFVSQKNFCVLDPHEKFLRGQRGMKYDLTERDYNTGRSALQDLKGQLKPFENMFGFSSKLMERGMKYDGTVFRFPLRNDEHIKWSEIRSIQYSESEALKLIEMTQKYAKLFLIFLQFVNKFKICIWRRGAREPDVISNFERHFNGGAGRETSSQVLFGTVDRFKSSYQISITNTVNSEKYQWDIFINAPGKKSKDGTRNVGAIAFPSHGLDLSSITELRILFCFLPLPLPEDTGLPFLVNGTFAVTSSRRSLQFGTIDDKSNEQASSDGAWNRDILQLGVAPALCDALIEKSKTHSQKELFNLIPSKRKLQDNFTECLNTVFYRNLTTDRNMKIFTSMTGELQKCALADDKVFVISNTIPMEVQKSIASILTITPMRSYHWLSVSEELTENINFYQPQFLIMKTKQFHWLLEYILPHFKEIVNLFSANWLEKYRTIIHYALSKCRYDQSLRDLLRNEHWIVFQCSYKRRHNECSTQKNFALPNQLIWPKSKNARMLEFSTKYFPSPDMCFDEHHYEVLCSYLGMNNEFLPAVSFADIIDNLNAISRLSVCREQFKQYVSHIESNEGYYKQFAHLVFKDLHIPIPVTPNSTSLSVVKRPVKEVYQSTLEPLVGYIHTLCDFHSFGAEKGGFFDRTVKLYKKVNEQDAIKNWISIIGDSNKTYDSKCEQIAKLLDFYESELGKPSCYIKDWLSTENVLPAKAQKRFCTIPKVCLDQTALFIDDYIYCIHGYVYDKKNAREFLKQCGVVDKFGRETYIDLINSLNECKTPNQVTQLRSILEFVRNEVSNEVKTNHILKLPDKNGIMKRVENLCLNDYSYASSRGGILESNLTYCHPLLPHDLMAYFGVKTKRNMVLSNHSKPLFESFTQKESLCRRLSRICQDYSSPMDIFKELTQNADDAGASEIHFILDQRKLRKKQVLDEGWEKLLDPALLVFNNSFFKSKDMEGIQELGTGSKSEDVLKIGQFGIGFNCVYNLTDFPSFLTQVDKQGVGCLCMFDPTFQIPSADGGCKVEATPDLVSAYTDSFTKCFLTDYGNFNAFKGKTMFRLPLRKENNAELNACAVNIGTLMKNLELFASKIPKYLLFLQNLRQITVSTLDQLGLKTFASYHKEVSPSSRNDFDNFRTRFAHNLENCTQIRGFNCSLLYEVEIKSKLEGRVCSKWRVCEQIGSSVGLPPVAQNASLHNQIRVKQHAAVAWLLQGRNRTVTGSEFAAELDTMPPLSCYLPIEESSTQLKREEIELPVSVNGQFFLDRSRALISLELNEVKGCWNSYVLEHVVGPAYANLILSFIGGDQQFELKRFMSKFPQLKSGVSRIHSLHGVSFLVAKGLLKTLSENPRPWVPVLKNDRTFIEFARHNQVFNSVLHNEAALSADDVKLIYNLALRLGLKLTKIERKFLKIWEACGLTVAHLSPNTILNEVENQVQVPQKINGSVFKNRDTLFQLLKWCGSKLPSHPSINSLPIYLSASGVLHSNKDETQKLYSSEHQIFEVFPQLKDRIFDERLEVLLRELEVTCEICLGDFIKFFENFHPELCKGQDVRDLTQILDPNLSQIEIEEWIKLVWTFFCFKSSDIEKYKNKFQNLSILLCFDKEKKNILKPVSSGNEVVFAKLTQRIMIGPVPIDPSEYFGLFEAKLLSPFISQFVIGERLSPEQQAHILRVINDNNDQVLERFNIDKRQHLYGYLRDCFGSSEGVDSSTIKDLRSLPIYETMNGEHEALDTVLCVSSIPKEIPKKGMSLCKTLADFIVPREETDSGVQFQTKLGIIKKTIAQFYVEFVIPAMFRRFYEITLCIHLEFLQNNLSTFPESEQKTLTEMLKQTAFIKASDSENFIYIWNFYDPSNYLYRIFRKSALLPESFRDYTKLLIECGLKSQISVEEFWEFATLQASTSLTGWSDKITYYMVLDYLFREFIRLKLTIDDFKKMMNLTLFETMKHGLCSLNGEIFLPECRSLVEHVKPVLTDKVSEILRKGRSHLKKAQRFVELWRMISSNSNNLNPKAELVVENIKKLLNKQPKPNSLLEDLLECIKFVVDETNSPNSSHDFLRKQLSQLPCIPISNQPPTIFLPPMQICQVFKCEYCTNHSNCEELCCLKDYISEPIKMFMEFCSYGSCLGTSKLVNLQQIVVALGMFHHKTQGLVWKDNPTSQATYNSLCDHLFYLMDKFQEDIPKLSSSFPIFLQALDGYTKDIHECIVFDDEYLFFSNKIKEKLASCDRDDFFLKKGTLIEINRQELYSESLKFLKNLPQQLRPQFLTEITKKEFDGATLEPGNCVREEMCIDEVEVKLSDEQFLEKVRTVFDHEITVTSSFHANDRLPMICFPFDTVQKIENKVLNALKTIKIEPYKKVLYRYTVECNQQSVNLLLDREFHIDKENKRIIFACPFMTSKFQTQTNCDKMKECILGWVTQQLFRLANHAERIDSKLIEILSKLIFLCMTPEAEDKLLQSHGIDFSSTTYQPPTERSLIGEIVLYSAYAIIEHCPFRVFTKDEIVAIKTGEVGEDNIYIYGKYLETVSEAKKFDRVETKKSGEKEIIINGSKVFGFRETLATVNKATGGNGETSDCLDEGMKRDIEEIKSIIWTNGECKSKLKNHLKEFEDRLIKSILEKYTNQQNNLIKALKDSIQKECDAQRTKKCTEINLEGEIVDHYIVPFFSRMQNYIESFQNQQLQVEIGKRSKRCEGSRNNQSLRLVVELAAVQLQPHPVLAKLWLKQASEDMQFVHLTWKNDSFHKFTNCLAAVSVKVIENSMAALLLVKDGRTELPHSDNGNFSSYKTISEHTVLTQFIHLINEKWSPVDQRLTDELIKVECVSQIFKGKELFCPDSLGTKTSASNFSYEQVNQIINCANNLYDFTKTMVNC